MSLHSPACSEVSLAVGEPLPGTAAYNDVFFLLEHCRPWEPKPLDSDLAPGLRATLARWLDRTPRSRLQLIRRPETPRARAATGGAASTALYVASTGGATRWVRRFALGEGGRGLDEAALDRLDLDALLETGEHPRAEPVDHPLHLVCVHGRRDQCCGRHGPKVYETARAHALGGRVWQTTHLGGHRFAAVTLTLPDGLCWGRMRAEHAAHWLEATARAEVPLVDHLRGRCALDPVAQAAEVWLRANGSPLGVDDVRWTATEPLGADRWSVHFETPDGARAVAVQRRALSEPRPKGCGEEPKPAWALDCARGSG